MLVINPDEWIDCALCEPECPIEAIKSEDDLTEQEEDFLEINAKFSQIWPNITEKCDPPIDAAQWKGKPNKKRFLPDA